MKSVLEYLEASVQKYPEKIIFADEKHQVSYNQFVEHAKKQRVKSVILSSIRRKNRLSYILTDA